MLIKRFLIGILAILALCYVSLAQANSELVLIKAGKLLDVRTGKLLTGQGILIEKDKIKSVGSLDNLISELPVGSQIIDLSQKVILPGLIDCHTHLTFDPTQVGTQSLIISNPREALYGAKNARLTLEAGFTTVRNVGAGGYSDIALRDAINDGDIPGPRIVACGPAMGITGGHCDSNVLAPEFHYKEEGIADGVPNVIQKTREIIKYGADCIKVCATGGVLSKGDSPGAEQFSDEEMQAIVKEAHRLGRKVAAHAHGASGIKQAVITGVDSIEHGSFINEEDINLMKERGTYLVPTLYLGDWLPANYIKIRLPEYAVKKMQVVIPMARQNIAKAFKSGVKVAFGTDAAVYPHGLNAKEFAVMVKLGLSPMAAIQSATINAADLLNLSNQVGVLGPETFADIIAVDGDPTSDVTVLENVSFVMKSGQIVKGSPTVSKK